MIPQTNISYKYTLFASFVFQTELAITKQKCELALAKVRQLEDENETIRIYYRYKVYLIYISCQI